MRNHVTASTPPSFALTVDPRPTSKASRRPDSLGTRLAAEQRTPRPPTPPPSHPQLSEAVELVLSPANHEDTTLTCRVRHVAPYSVRAAWATAEGASTDSRRPRAAPLKPAHLSDARCVLRRGDGGRGQVPGAEPQARAGRLRNSIGWLARPPHPAPPRGSASARALWNSPSPRLRWKRMRSPPQRLLACGRSPDRGFLTFAGFDGGLDTRLFREHSVNSSSLLPLAEPLRLVSVQS